MSELGIGPDFVSQNDASRISYVSLHGRVIRDERIAHLRDLVDLSTLVLFDSTVSDACLLHLKRHPMLHHVFIAGSKITEQGAVSLERARPDMMVFRKGEGAVQDASGKWKKARYWWELFDRW